MPDSTPHLDENTVSTDQSADAARAMQAELETFNESTSSSTIAEWLDRIANSLHFGAIEEAGLLFWYEDVQKRTGFKATTCQKTVEEKLRQFNNAERKKSFTETTRPRFAIPNTKEETTVTWSQSAERIFRYLGKGADIYISADRVTVVQEQSKRGRPGPNTGLVQLVEMRPSRFRSWLEKHGTIVIERPDPKTGAMREQKTVLSTDAASALLAADEAREYLPHISFLSERPLLLEIDGELRTLEPGLDEETGILVMHGPMPERIPGGPEEAAGALRGLLRDFRFATPGDRSRALAAMVTPAMKMAGLLPEPTPAVDIEADKSQAGKGYFDTLVHLLYAERPYVISSRKGGVGSLDESFCAAILAGRAFIQFDNYRGRLDSQVLESMLTNPNDTAARTPHREEIRVDATGMTVSITSNGMETTPDLANRLNVIRLTKQEPGYRWHEWPEGSLHDHVRVKQPYYLGCIHELVQSWYLHEQLRKDAQGHDMRLWAGSLGWIVEELFDEAPLLSGHRSIQDRLSVPHYAWLREVARAVTFDGLLNEALSAKALLDLCEETDIRMPNKRTYDGAQAQGQQYIGRIMKQVFRGEDGGSRHWADVDGRWLVFRIAAERVTHPDSWHGRAKTKTYYQYLFCDWSDETTRTLYGVQPEGE